MWKITIFYRSCSWIGFFFFLLLNSFIISWISSFDIFQILPYGKGRPSVQWFSGSCPQDFHSDLKTNKCSCVSNYCLFYLHMNEIFGQSYAYPKGQESWTGNKFGANILVLQTNPVFLLRPIRFSWTKKLSFWTEVCCIPTLKEFNYKPERTTTWSDWVWLHWEGLHFVPPVVNLPAPQPREGGSPQIGARADYASAPGKILRSTHKCYMLRSGLNGQI